MIARSSVGRLTTVARTCRAQSSRVATPEVHHHHVVVDVGAGAVLGHHRVVGEAAQRRGGAAGAHLDRDAVRREEPQRLGEERQRPGRGVGEDHQAGEAQAGQPVGEAGERQRGGRGLRAVAAEAGVAFDEHRQRPPAAAGAGREAFEHGFVVGDHAQARDRAGEVDQAADLVVADDVEADEDVVGDAGEDLGLADLLAGDADGAGGDLHRGDRRDLVGLDMRAVVAAGGGDEALHAVDVRGEAVEIDGDAGGVEPLGGVGGRGAVGALGHDGTCSAGVAAS